MKSFINKLQSKNAVWLSALILCASQMHAQQLTDPTQNAPDGSAITLTPADSAYPSLMNMTNPSGLYNYVKTIVPDVPVPTITASMYDRISTDYFDGLGRPLQTVAQKAHANGNDIVVPHVYDALGRETYQYQPFASPIPMIDLLNPAGKMKLSVSTQMHGFYNLNGIDEQPYSQTVFENSPLSRPIKQMSPGKSWVGTGNGVTYDYSSNGNWNFNTALNAYILGGGYPRWTIASTANALPVYQGDYGKGELSITTVTDEDGKKSQEVKDKQGRIVMKMAGFTTSYNNQLRPSDYLYTHYVYDDIGNLRCVIPPAVKPTPSGSVGSVTWSLSNEQMNNLCYTYFYDERNRLIQKKIPGKDIEYFVYDLRDRLVMHQDGNLRNAVGYGDGLARWEFTYYDALDRPTMQTICTANEDGNLMSVYVNDNSVWPAPHWLHYFKDYGQIATYPSSIGASTILSYTYYDDYNQLTNFSFDPNQFLNVLLSTDGTTVPSIYSSMTRGLVTGGKTRVTDPDNPTVEKWLTSVNYYDDKGRLIQTQTQNLNGGIDISSNIYYFQGALYKNILRHQNPGAKPIPNATDGAITEYKIINTFKRNLGINGGNDQVWQHKQMINGGIDYEFADYDYDHLGRVVVKQFTAGSMLQEYNMRGFLNHIDFKNVNTAPYNELFDEKLFYDKGFSNKLYNGNIAGITWHGQDNVQKSYGYSYDNLNRLNHAEFRQLNGTNWGKTTDYTASNITYDFNGNIQTMNQMAPVSGANIPMDVLTYTYAANSNKLLKVADAGTVNATLPDFKDGANNTEEYRYDLNGNLTVDDNKYITSITYNYLNKPEKITVGGPTPGVITYVYDASGNRLLKKVQNNLTSQTEEWAYFGNFVYKNATLQYILNEEGRARPVAAGLDGVPDNSNPNAHPTKFIYDYFVKDHLGNVRSTVTANPMTYQYLAGHEVGMANIEQLVFDNIPTVRDNKPGSTDPNDGMAAALDGGNATRVGTAILLKTSPGDQFKISVDAFYDQSGGNNGTAKADDIVKSLMTALTGGSTYAGVPLSELPDNIKTIQTLLGNPNLAGAIQQMTNVNDDPSAPKAHLNYLWFDDRMQLDTKLSGSIQVPVYLNGASSWTTLVPHNTGNVITLPNGNIGGSNVTGYLLVYIDNQSIGKKVWFDNLAIGQYTSTVVEEDHYYPFGLTMNTFNNNAVQNGVKQPYLLTTKELESNFGINSYDFGARMQDMTIGRWYGIDELSERFYNISPYAYCANNPVLYFDKDGRIIGTIIGAVGGAIFGGVKAAINGQNVWNGAAKGAVSGAIGGAIIDITVATAGTGLVPLVVGGAAAGMFSNAASQAMDASDGTRNGTDVGEMATATATGAVLGIVEAAAPIMMGKFTGEVGPTVRSEVDAQVAAMQESGQSPATVVGAELPNGARQVSTSGRIPSEIAPSLENAANKIGGVGSKRSGNTIGCCSEFRAGNKLLLDNPQYKPTDVKFTPAIRPRTGEIVPPCDNCNDIFKIK